jgi:hypothetical protein
MSAPEQLIALAGVTHGPAVPAAITELASAATRSVPAQTIAGAGGSTLYTVPLPPVAFVPARYANASCAITSAGFVRPYRSVWSRAPVCPVKSQPLANTTLLASEVESSPPEVRTLARVTSGHPTICNGELVIVPGDIVVDASTFSRCAPPGSARSSSPRRLPVTRITRFFSTTGRMLAACANESAAGKLASAVIVTVGVPSTVSALLVAAGP